MTDTEFNHEHVATNRLAALGRALLADTPPIREEDPLMPHHKHLLQCPSCRQRFLRELEYLIEAEDTSGVQRQRAKTRILQDSYEFEGPDRSGLIYDITRLCRIFHLNLVAMRAIAIRDKTFQSASGLTARIAFQVVGGNRDLAEANVQQYLDTLARAPIQSSPERLRLSDPNNVVDTVVVGGDDSPNVVLDFVEFLQVGCQVRILNFNARVLPSRDASPATFRVRLHTVVPLVARNELLARMHRWADPQGLFARVRRSAWGPGRSAIFDSPLSPMMLDGATGRAQRSVL